MTQQNQERGVSDEIKIALAQIPNPDKKLRKAIADTIKKVIGKVSGFVEKVNISVFVSWATIVLNPRQG
jgi:hypothetical protein